MQFADLHICFIPDILLELEYKLQNLSPKSTAPPELLIIPIYIIYWQLYSVCIYIITVNYHFRISTENEHYMQSQVLLLCFNVKE